MLPETGRDSIYPLSLSRSLFQFLPGSTSLPLVAKAKSNVVSALRGNLPRGGRLLVAVSGGQDSVVLLHGCQKLKRLLKLELEVAHVDHGLRKQSKGDAQFVRRLSKSAGLKFHLKRAVPPAKRSNLEAWGRKIRYSFFAEVLKSRKLDFVLTAHTADDLSETFLMKLVSNKELSGISKIDRTRKVIRPLLEVSRSTIEKYARMNELEHVEDESNQDLKFLRNRIRHVLLPFLEHEFGPRIREVMSERARAVAEDVESMYQWIEPPLARIAGHKFGSKPWLGAVKAEIKGLPDPAAWRLAEKLVYPKLGFKIGRKHATALVKFFLERRAGLELPGGVSLHPHNGGILLG